MSDELIELPEGWEQVKLGEIIELKYGKGLVKTVRDGGKYAVYGSNGVVGAHSQFLIEKPCLVVGRKGSIGEVHLSEKPCWAIDTTYYIDDLHNQPINFWFYRLKALSLEELNRASAIPGLNREDAYSLSILLPPLNEQKRIVAAIEALRERSQKARSALSAIPELCDKFRQSVLAAAFRGDLTADWREQNPDVEPASVVLERIRLERRLKWQEKELRRMKFQGKTPKDDKWKQKYKEPDKIEELADIELPDLPDGWVWLSADECTSWITDGEHATPERSEEGIYLLSARNVLNGRVSLDKVDFVSEQVHRKLEERLKIEPGDVFLSCSGTVGRSCVVPPDVQCSLVRSVAVLKPLFEMGEYLSLSIRSPYVQSQIEQKKTQTAQSNIFQGRIKTLAIPIAPLNEQKVIIEQITEAFRFIQSVEQIIQLLDDRGEHLDRSILAKAFRGELVEQDPNDEPAAVLLERIRVDREQQMRGKIKKPGKKKRTGD